MIACLDLEGVLVPEIWINVAERTGIPALRRTTRDEPDYDKLMRGRLAILDEHHLGLPDIQGVIGTMELLDGALDGRIRGLWILGENVAMTDPDLTHVHECLRACEFLVVQEIFLSETARFAHVVLPAAAMAEKAGTFTNTERRIQLSPPVVPAPGDARPDWWIIREIGKQVSRRDGRALSGARFAGWDHSGPVAIMHEIAALVPIYAGVSHGRLEHQGLQWPCPPLTIPELRFSMSQASRAVALGSRR